MKIAQMLPKFVVTAVFLAASFSTVDAAVVKSSAKNVIASESVGQTAVRTGPAPKATVATVVNGKQVLTNVSAPVVVPAAAKAAVVTTSTTIQSTVLIFARDSVSAYSAFSGLNAYGIPYQVVVVPQAGITLPVLNSSATAGNYGAIVILSEVSYDYGGTLGYQSALNTTGSDIRISSSFWRTTGSTGFLPVTRLWHSCPWWLLQHRPRAEYFDFECGCLSYGRFDCVSPLPKPS
jgi:hypothetical protein